MTRLLTLSAALLFATAASAQMAPSSGGFEPSADNCKKPQYSTTDECKNFLEGRSSSTGTNQQPGGTVGSSQSPGNSSGSGSSGGSGSGAGGGAGGGSN
jgi:hypothetical protein